MGLSGHHKNIKSWEKIKTGGRVKPQCCSQSTKGVPCVSPAPRIRPVQSLCRGFLKAPLSRTPVTSTPHFPAKPTFYNHLSSLYNKWCFFSIGCSEMETGKVYPSPSVFQHMEHVLRTALPFCFLRINTKIPHPPHAPLQSLPSQPEPRKVSFRGCHGDPRP